MRRDGTIESDSIPDGYISFQEAKESLPSATRKHVSEEVALEMMHISGTGPALVFIHGGLGSLWNPFPQLYAFAGDRELITYALAGNGNSTTRPEQSIGGHVTDLQNLLDSPDIDRPIIHGHSYGTAIAIEYAKEHPTSGLVLHEGGDHGLTPAWEKPLLRFFFALWLYRSLNGDDWTDLGVPHEEVYSVVATPAGERLYAGTHPAHLYACTAFSGDNATGPTECDWHEVDGFQDLPSRDEWYTPHHRNEAHIRSLGTHPDAPGRLVAGAEAGGVHLSDDDGETWGERTADVPDDIHHLLVRGADEYIASTGFGLHHTTDAGRSWTRLDEGIEQRYFPEAIDHDGILYTSAAMGPSPHWDDGADAVLLESRNERTFEAVDLPRPDEVVLAWTVVDGEVIAGTNDGTLLTQRGDEWTVVGELPVNGQGVRSLCPDLMD